MAQLYHLKIKSSRKGQKLHKRNPCVISQHCHKKIYIKECRETLVKVVHILSKSAAAI